MFRLVIAADSWATVGTVAGVAGVCVALIVFWLQSRRTRKALGYEITQRPLVQVGHEARGKVEIRYDGVKVSDVNLLQVVLRNTGRVPILREDFDRPVVVGLMGQGRGSRVSLLQSTLTITSDPTSMNPGVAIQGNAIIFQPVLLNPGDCVTMGVLATGYSGTNVSVEVDARVAGLRTLQTTPDRLRESQRWLARLGLSTSTLATATVALVALGASVVSIEQLVRASETAHDRVVLLSGTDVCGDLLSQDTNRIALTLKGSGKIQIIPLSRVYAIQKNRC